MLAKRIAEAGSMPIILRQGVLLKRGTGSRAGRRSWDCRLFSLTSDGVMHYCSSRAFRHTDPPNGSSKQVRAHVQTAASDMMFGWMFRHDAENQQEVVQCTYRVSLCMLRTHP